MSDTGRPTAGAQASSSNGTEGNGGDIMFTVDDTSPMVLYFPFGDSQASSSGNSSSSSSTTTTPDLTKGWTPCFSISGCVRTQPSAIPTGTSYHVSSQPGSSLTILWRGTGIQLLGNVSNPTHINYVLTLDGNVTQPDFISLNDQLLASFQKLNNDDHNVTLTLIQTNSPSALPTIPSPLLDPASDFVAFDKALIIAPPPPSIQLNDQHSFPRVPINTTDIAFFGHWSFQNDTTTSLGAFYRSTTAGDSITTRFSATTFLLSGTTTPDSGIYTVSLATFNSSTPPSSTNKAALLSNTTTRLTAKSSFTNPNALLYYASDLDPTHHHVLTITNSENAQLAINATGFQIFASSPPITPQSTAPNHTQSPVPLGDLTSTHSVPKGTIAALSLAGVLAFILLTASLFFFFVYRPRKRSLAQSRYHFGPPSSQAHRKPYFQRGFLARDKPPSTTIVPHDDDDLTKRREKGLSFPGFALLGTRRRSLVSPAISSKPKSYDLPVTPDDDLEYNEPHVPGSPDNNLHVHEDSSGVVHIHVPTSLHGSLNTPGAGAGSNRASKGSSRSHRTSRGSKPSRRSASSRRRNGEGLLRLGSLGGGLRDVLMDIARGKPSPVAALPRTPSGSASSESVSMSQLGSPRTPRTPITPGTAGGQESQPQSQYHSPPQSRPHSNVISLAQRTQETQETNYPTDVIELGEGDLRSSLGGTVGHHRYHSSYSQGARDSSEAGERDKDRSREGAVAAGSSGEGGESSIIFASVPAGSKPNRALGNPLPPSAHPYAFASGIGDASYQGGNAGVGKRVTGAASRAMGSVSSGLSSLGRLFKWSGRTEPGTGPGVVSPFMGVLESATAPDVLDISSKHRSPTTEGPSRDTDTRAQGTTSPRTATDITPLSYITVSAGASSVALGDDTGAGGRSGVGAVGSRSVIATVGAGSLESTPKPGSSSGSRREAEKRKIHNLNLTIPPSPFPSPPGTTVTTGAGAATDRSTHHPSVPRSVSHSQSSEHGYPLPTTTSTGTGIGTGLAGIDVVLPDRPVSHRLPIAVVEGQSDQRVSSAPVAGASTGGNASGSGGSGGAGVMMTMMGRPIRALPPLPGSASGELFPLGIAPAEPQQAAGATSGSGKAQETGGRGTSEFLDVKRISPFHVEFSYEGGEDSERGTKRETYGSTLSPQDAVMPGGGRRSGGLTVPGVTQHSFLDLDPSSSSSSGPASTRHSGSSSSDRRQVEKEKEKEREKEKEKEKEKEEEEDIVSERWTFGKRRKRRTTSSNYYYHAPLPSPASQMTFQSMQSPISSEQALSHSHSLRSSEAHQPLAQQQQRVGRHPSWRGTFGYHRPTMEGSVIPEYDETASTNPSARASPSANVPPSTVPPLPSGSIPSPGQDSSQLPDYASLIKALEAQQQPEIGINSPQSSIPPFSPVIPVPASNTSQGDTSDPSSHPPQQQPQQQQQQQQRASYNSTNTMSTAAHLNIHPLPPDFAQPTYPPPLRLHHPYALGAIGSSTHPGSSTSPTTATTTVSPTSIQFHHPPRRRPSSESAAGLSRSSSSGDSGALQFASTSGGGGFGGPGNRQPLPPIPSVPPTPSAIAPPTYFVQRVLGMNSLASGSGASGGTGTGSSTGAGSTTVAGAQASSSRSRGLGHAGTPAGSMSTSIKQNAPPSNEHDSRTHTQR
ncbi:hypothetical protein AMATHDRAFT_41836 [Amanita thiersii Skay4041]|uniref:Uncharacterized protein n=1 Tax=Amanita thiersii Skay4041 TaxID=703135 RepID=A0A2A9NMW2_9AGAR|nr:hypothetical protein AMATHDRAFT_41836 [Amanita thiersii Skay4041]